MKNFSKSEIISILIIFFVLIVVSWPNFALSLRRARDQTRRDDIGNVQAAIDAYYADYGIFPSSDAKGELIACKDPNQPILNVIACKWGKDAWVSLTPGVNKTYMGVLPGDPKLSNGRSYAYFSDGSRYQLYGSLESADEPGYDPKLASKGFKCGSSVCNVGRANNVPLYITIEEYDMQIYCSEHPSDAKCINKQISK